MGLREVIEICITFEKKKPRFADGFGYKRKKKGMYLSL